LVLSVLRNNEIACRCWWDQLVLPFLSTIWSLRTFFLGHRLLRGSAPSGTVFVPPTPTSAIRFSVIEWNILIWLKQQSRPASKADTMAEDNVPTTQSAPEAPGVEPGESATLDPTPSHNTYTSAMAQSAGTALDGTAPDLVQAGPSGAVPVAGAAPAPPPARESIGARTVRRANDPEWMEQMRLSGDPHYAYMVAVRDRRTSDPRSLNLGWSIRPSAPSPAVNRASMNGTMNGTTNGTTHLNGAPPRTLNGSTPETRVRSYLIYND
jgi:hypothetical protein